MIINSLDLGGRHPYQHPVTGQVLGSLFVEGRETVSYSRGSQAQSQTVSFVIRAWQGIGGAAALSSTALRYLVKQVEELAGNPDMNPVYIQWTATGESGAPINAAELHDGWFNIEEFSPNWDAYAMGPAVPCRLSVVLVAPAPPSCVFVAHLGGAVPTDFSGTIKNLVSVSLGASLLQGNAFRSGAEGLVGYTGNPVNPTPVTLSATIANWFKGGVRVYDTLNTTSNPVPTTGGTFVHANWVEVFGSKHDFVGDCVVTNGLLLFLIQAGQAEIGLVYLWNPALATANWQLIGQSLYYDNATGVGTLQSFFLDRVNPEECSVRTVNSTANGQVSEIFARLQRGRFGLRLRLKPRTQASTNPRGLSFQSQIGNPKIVFNPLALGDPSRAEGLGGIPTDYGYMGAFVANANAPVIMGWLVPRKIAGNQGWSDGVAQIAPGDTTSLAIDAERECVLYAAPYGVNGSYSTADLQREMESGSLTGGFVSAADGGTSGGNAAKLPSGTAVGSAADQASYKNFTQGTFDVYVRARVTSNASGTTQIRIGLRDATSGWVAGGYTDYAPSAFTSGYLWYRVATGYAPDVAHVHAMRAEGITNAAATDFWLDEMAVVPRTISFLARDAESGPQDLWAQEMYDRSVVLAV